MTTTTRHLPAANLLYLPNLLIYRKEVHHWSIRSPGVSTLLQDNTWTLKGGACCTDFVVPTVEIMAVTCCWTRRQTHVKKKVLIWTWVVNWRALYSASGRTDQQTERCLVGWSERKTWKTFWMIKWSSFDVAEFKYAHVTFVIDRQTEHPVHFLNNCHEE